MNTWIGTKTNGIEFRSFDDSTLDEVCLYVDGECVFHLEMMDDHLFWVGLYAKSNKTAHLYIGAKNGMAHVKCTGKDQS